MSKKVKKVKQEVQDTSPYVWQRDKINFDFSIRALKWTEKQQKFLDLALSKETKILFVKGAAGTTKTFLSVFVGLELLKSKKVSEIVLVRTPVESADSKLGFLPGDLSEKIGVYIEPFRDKLDELISEDTIRRLERDKRLLIRPVNFARGLHWAAKAIIADECQNFTSNELKTLLTRIGQFTKVILCGDPEQSDLPNGKGKSFEQVCDLFNTDEAKEQGIHVFEFTDDDILRSEIVKFIVKTFRGL